VIEAAEPTEYRAFRVGIHMACQLGVPFHWRVVPYDVSQCLVMFAGRCFENQSKRLRSRFHLQSTALSKAVMTEFPNSCTILALAENRADLKVLGSP
jgi:hypothetical protein